MSGVGVTGEDCRPSQFMEFQNLFRMGIKCFLTSILIPAILAPNAA